MTTNRTRAQFDRSPRALSGPATSARRGARRAFTRAGFSMVEVQVAFVLFGIALAGIGPCLAMYTKHLRKVQQRFDPQNVYYLVPSTDLWTRKLGAAAALATLDPGPVTPPAMTTPPANTVEVNSLDRSMVGQDLTATVTVQAAGP